MNQPRGEAARNSGDEREGRPETDCLTAPVLKDLDARVPGFPRRVELVFGDVVAAVLGDFLPKLVELFQAQLEGAGSERERFLLSSKGELQRLLLLIEDPLDVFPELDAGRGSLTRHLAIPASEEPEPRRPRFEGQ